MSHPEVIETPRLTLRDFTADDLGELSRQLADPEVMRYYPEPLTVEGSEKWLQGILRDYDANGFGMLAAHLRETGEYVGQVGIMRRVVSEQERHFLSYLICREFWGQGYGTEAVRALLSHGFRALGIRKIEAIIHPDNAPSLRLARKVGMRMESTVTQFGVEHHVYGVTEEQAVVGK